MNYGIWDAVTLTSKLAWAERVLARNPDATDAVESIFDSYAQERHSMGGELIKTVKAATLMVSSRNRFLQIARNALVRVAVPLASKHMLRGMAQLDLKYKPSYSKFIIPSGWFTTNLTYPGHRLPNLILADGTRLYKLVDRTRYTWVYCNMEAPEGEDENGQNCIYVTPAMEQTSVPEIAQSVLKTPQVILVRPDLFVAAVDATTDAVLEAFGEDCYTTM